MQLINGLQAHHALFYQLWLLGKPQFSETIKTAAVGFDKEGEELFFLLNKDFWESLTRDEKLFVLSHECVHVMLNHGMRAIGKGHITPLENVAMDLVVNHLLTDSFGFNRSVIDSENKWCWIDVVFKEKAHLIKSGQTFEYYLSKLKEHFPKQDGEGDGEGGEPGEEGKAGDSSGPGGTVLDEHTIKDFSKVLKEVGESLTNDEKETLKDMLKKHMPKSDPTNTRGTTALGMEYLVPKKIIKRKRKWETVVKKWANKYMTHDHRDTDQWLRTHRRWALIDSDLILPSEMEIEDTWEDTKRIEVYFFSDTSGSCSGYMDRFFAAAESLPVDRFDVKMHCFDTEVYETTLKSRKLYGFGGTSFTCIENYIQKYIKKNNLKYPKKCFIITDGYGDKVNPEKPKNWDWFLTPGGSTNCIPAVCNKHLLADFE